MRFLTSRSYIFSITALVLFSIILLTLNHHSIFDHKYPIGDLALSKLQILEAQNFNLLAGPYSRFHFNHPGPIYSYIYSLGEWLFGIFGVAPYSAHTLTQLVLNLFLLLCIARIVRAESHSLHAEGAFVLSAMIALSSIGTAVFTSTWGPAVVVVPMLGVLSTAAALVNGRWSVLPLHVCCVCLATQAHLSTWAVALPLEIIIVSYLAFRYYSTAQHRSEILGNLKIGALIGFILYLPPILDLCINGTKSNLVKIFNFILKGEGHRSVLDVLSFIEAYYIRIVPIAGSLGPYFLTFLIVLSLFATFRLKSPFLYRLISIAIFSLVLSVYAATQIKGELEQYLLWYQVSIAAILMFPIIFSLAKFIESKLIGITLLIALVCLIALRTPVTQLNPQSDSSIPSLAKEYRAQPGVPYKLMIKPSSNWPQVAGIFLYMRARGLSPCVEKRWRFMFGSSAICQNLPDLA